ncbi:hypothetical protein ACTXG6_06685 [Pseudonocardia sp. Cha107L01]|uniref:hypothetical protein n=1 Tax=Pseudonocardia sp. Cha107L01 TaxID=3457576 RepID=UPI00403EEB4C
MNLISLDQLYALQKSAEILRAIVDDGEADRLSLSVHGLESFLGAQAHDEPWFTALGPLRKATWHLHTLPLPTDHSAMGLHDHYTRAATAVLPLAEGGSAELQYWASEALEALQQLTLNPSMALSQAIKEMVTDGADTSATLLIRDPKSVPAVWNYFAATQLPLAAVLTAPELRDYPAHASQLVVCQPPLGMTTECRVCAVELADPVWFGRVVLTVFVGAVTVTIFGSG